MIQVLFTVLGLEVALVLVLLFKTPLRKVAILGLDRLKRGRGPVMVKTVAATVLVVLASSGYSIVKIHDRSNEMGQLTPTDQVLASRHLLEASLMGNFFVSPYPCAQSLSV
jgi:B-cell receptor-associated protein 31